MTNTTTAEARAAVFRHVPREPLFAEEEAYGEWVSAFTYKAVKIDVSHLAIPTLTPIIEAVMESRTTSTARQALLASFQDSVALYGAACLETLNAHFARYPRELATRCIQSNASFGAWSMRMALLDRQDMVALHHVIDSTVLQMLRLLFALNHVYVRSEQCKWFKYNASKLAIKPEHFEERVTALLAAPTAAALAALDTLVHEVFALVHQQRPDIDITQPLQTVRYVRQKLPAAYLS